MKCYKIAIVGAGPAGYFAAQALQNLANEEISFSIDMIERLPTPWGLVRSGVAPDHPKIKTVSKVFEKIANTEGFRLFANVELGTDLTIPGALLAGVIAGEGDRGRAEGAYFGWWNFATKLNLALAAGVALPALAWLGYTPGARDAQALNTLTFAYCLLPCALKAVAAALLTTLVLRRSP